MDSHAQKVFSTFLHLGGKNVNKYTRNEKICELYFSEKKTFSEIAKKINISVSQISRIVRKNENYIEEKNERKRKSKEKRIDGIKKAVIRKRNSRANEKAVIDYLHNQASRILSERKTINNRAFKKWNSSIYEYDGETSEYRIKKVLEDKVSYAAPRKIKWK